MMVFLFLTVERRERRKSWAGRERETTETRKVFNKYIENGYFALQL